MVVVVVVISSVVVVDVVVVVGGATSENKLNSILRRFSLPAPAAGFEPSRVGLRVERSTTVLSAHSQIELC
jgi:hypothetical protein